ncbi:MAG TPA: tetratricopeptide repeat protein [Candidatus Polarisedimenticolia bacterium]|jgi:tetratricopeptide (TPR) repeat protein
MLAAIFALAVVSGPAPAAAGQIPPATHADSYYSYCLARQAWSRQDYVEALRQMQAAVETDPSAADLMLDLARLHLELNQYEDAAASARRAVGLNPGSAAAHRMLGDALLVLVQREGSEPGLAQEAVEAYQQAVRLDPTDADAHLSLARLLITRGAYAQALDALRKHLDLAPHSVDGIYLAAHALARLNRFEEAESLLRAAIAGLPQDASLHIALMEICESAGKLDEAAEVGHSMLERNLEPIRANFALARLSQRRGRHGEAFDYFGRVAALMEQEPALFSDGDRAEIQVRMIHELMDAGRVPEAQSLAQAGGKRFAEDVRFVLREGEALLLQGRTAQAEELFRRQIPASAPDARGGLQISDTYLSAGARRERAGQFKEAESLLKAAIDWNSRSASALNYLGYMLADRGARLDEAIGYIRRALEIDPANGAFLDSLGWAYFKMGEYGRAEQYLGDALAALEQEPAIYDHLGDLYLATGRRDEAIEAWRKALHHGAENADAIRAKLGADAQPPTTRH